jgi:hypothetical protein
MSVTPVRSFTRLAFAIVIAAVVISASVLSYSSFEETVTRTVANTTTITTTITTTQPPCVNGVVGRPNSPEAPAAMGAVESLKISLIFLAV